MYVCMFVCMSVYICMPQTSHAILQDLCGSLWIRHMLGGCWIRFCGSSPPKAIITLHSIGFGVVLGLRHSLFPSSGFLPTVDQDVSVSCFGRLRSIG